MSKKIYGRHGARWVALQGLYALAFGASLSDIEADLNTEVFQAVSFDKAYLHELLCGISERRAALDALMEKHLDRALSEVSPIEHAILWIGVYELSSTEIPYRVVINEAILLAKQFGAQDSHKFVNGVLDKAAKAIRPAELVV